MGGYSLGNSVPKIENDSSQNYLPPLIELDIPAKTINGITTDLEAYYADGLRLVFAVRITEEQLSHAYEKLLQQGIDMEWKVYDYGNGGGGSGPVYNKLPVDISEEKAYAAFVEALGYIYKGAWVSIIKP